MSDHIDPSHPLVAELADTRERFAAVESELEARRQGEAAARDPQGELKRLEGEEIMRAINSARRRSDGGNA